MEIKRLKKIEEEYILEVLKIFNGNRTYTARALGIGMRTLQRKLKQYGMGQYLKDGFRYPPKLN